MAKKRFLFGALAAALAFGTLTAGCDNPSGGGTTPDTTAAYTVTFEVDGGSAVSNQSIQEGGTVTRPADPTKADTFDNWYQDADKTIQWSFDTDVVTADTTLYAKWAAGENLTRYTVTFDTDGWSTAPATQSILAGSKVARPADPTKSGHIFTGWYNGITAWDFSTGVTGAVTLKVKWVEAVTVTFNTNGGSTIADVTVPNGSEVYPDQY
ncbi:MAG: InlB B-repeat-containing protein [Spirochaetaceae bacterium]|nr:InlB B-repeat-containing protein [Spirochaetaceae bacterium]